MTEIQGSTSYIVAVLWMHGESAGRIAEAVKWNRDQVTGFIWRLFDKRPRSSFSMDERQAFLDEKKANRLDGGRLRDEHFIANKSAKEKEREQAESRAVEEPPDLSTRAGRKKARALKKEQEARAAAAQKAQERREMGHAERRGRTAGTKEKTGSSALEYLFDHRLLKDTGTENKAAARDGFLPEESRRLEAGLRLRAFIAGARTADLGAMDYERATMGTGGGPKLSLAAFKIHCIQQLGTVRRMMTQGEYVIIESIVDGDVFLWETEEPGSERRSAMYESIRYFLDIIGVHEGLMHRDDFKARWNDELPEVRRRSRAEASQQSAAATEFLEVARG